MSKKLTIEYVSEQFEKEGYILLSAKYISNKHKLNYICPKGHRHNITWNCWTKGARCWYCFGTPKKRIEDVKLEFEKEGYILLDTKYKDNKTKLNYICPKGHRYSTSWDNWHSGSRCPQCAGLKKLTLAQVRKSFEDSGYILLSDAYINSNTKLDYICVNGHRGSITWHDWEQGARCFTCKYIKQSGPGNPSWKGGISKEPYCQDWTKEYKQDIKERDGNRCLNPYCDSTNPSDLTVHHINYNKKDCRPENLITVCRSCNSRANTDRRWHMAWYKTIIKNRYSGVQHA